MGHPGSYHDLLSEKKYQQLLKKLQSSPILYTPASIAYEHVNMNRKTKSKSTQRRHLSSLSKLYYSPRSTVSKVRHQNAPSKIETRSRSCTVSAQSKKKLVVPKTETAKKKKKLKKSSRKEKKHKSFFLPDSDGDDSDGDLSTEISSHNSSFREVEVKEIRYFLSAQWEGELTFIRARFLQPVPCCSKLYNGSAPKTWMDLLLKVVKVMPQKSPK